MIKYVCKYTPLEILKGFNQQAELIDNLAEDFDLAGRLSHDNLCGFGKGMLQEVINSKAEELLLVNCCDTIRKMYEVIREENVCKFIFLLDLPHRQSCCAAKSLAKEFIRFKDEYEKYSNIKFDMNRFLNSLECKKTENDDGAYVAIMGVRCGAELEEHIREMVPGKIKNLTCVRNRGVYLDKDELKGKSEEEIFEIYAQAVLAQYPCGRMGLSEKRREIFSDPNLKGIIYHTIKFCDYYEYEYATSKQYIDIPVLKLETDYTRQSEGQLKTRIEAFVETLKGTESGKELIKENKNETVKLKNADPDARYFAGIDSGSTSTDVVIIDAEKNIVSSVIIPTGGGASISAEKALDEALKESGLKRSQIKQIVKTGYGRDYIKDGDESVTEITCHARGANYLNPNARTVIDIGGQDSKVIKIDEKGAVLNFVMNDKCAAGTGRFLEMMARTLDLSLEEMSKKGLDWKKDIAISSMCTVFAESEVVSLVAQNIALSDIIHGLNNSVAVKISTLANRVGMEEGFIMTGGVANNEGVVKAIEEKLKTKVFISDKAQICGAIGAALIASENAL